MKKIISFIVVLAVLLSVSACGLPGGDTPSAPAVSVRVSPLSQTCYSDDGSVLLLTYADAVPDVTVSGNSEASEAINAAAQELSTSYAAGDGEIYGIDAVLESARTHYAMDPDWFAGEYARHYAMQRTVDVTRADEAVLSLLYTAYENQGGVHPFTTLTAKSFSTVTGEALTLESLVNNAAEFRAACREYIISLVESGEYPENMFFENYADYLNDVIADDFWYFSEAGMVFIANQYVLAPYAAGCIQFTVPYSEISVYFAGEYMPAAVSGGEAGSVTAASVAQIDPAALAGSVTLDSEGELITLTADSDLHDVKLATVTYDGSRDTYIPSGTHLYFSTLLKGQTLAVQTYIPDTVPNLQISWRGGDGAHYSRLISSSGEDGSIILINHIPSPVVDSVNITDLLPYETDLTLDTASEQINLLPYTDSDSSDTKYALVVSNEHGASEYRTDIISDMTVWLTDVDGDGAREILLSGNIASDDYITVCLSFRAAEGLSVIPFEGDERYPDVSPDYFNGSVHNIDSSGLVLRSACHILGSYIGTREFVYSDSALRPAAGTAWSFTENNFTLKTTQSITVRTAGGDITALPAGSTIQITATDGTSWVQYKAEDGSAGFIYVEPSPDNFGYTIDGSPESEFFETIPYAG